MSNNACCGKRMIFNDNSITNIIAKGQLFPDSAPVFYCNHCGSYYDGFTAHEPMMKKFSLDAVKHLGCDQWFHPDTLKKLNEMRSMTKEGINGPDAYQKVFLNSNDPIPTFYYDGDAVYRIYSGGKKEKSGFSSLDHLYLELPEFSFSVFNKEEIDFMKEMIKQGRAKDFYEEHDVRNRIEYDLLEESYLRDFQIL